MSASPGVTHRPSSRGITNSPRLPHHRRSWALALALTAAATLWATALFATPVRVARHPSMFAALMYVAGDRVCHQRPERSFHIAGTQMPVCARCTGLYLSAAIGALAAWLGRPSVPLRIRVVLFAAAVPTAATWAAEWLGLIAGSNGLRFAAAVPLGGVAAWLIVRMLRPGRREHMRYDPRTYAHEIERRGEGAPRV